jgi:histidine ammonia-lyase
MNSRCGLEDCDCGYVIEKLMETLNVVRGILPASGSIGSDYLHLIGNMGRDIIDEGLKEAAK